VRPRHRDRYEELLFTNQELLIFMMPIGFGLYAMENMVRRMLLSVKACRILCAVVGRVVRTFTELN
jgi:hypothetical protein